MKKKLNDYLLILNDVINKYAVEIVILLITGIGMGEMWIDSYPLCYYFVDYSTGFGGRKLVGTIARLIYGNNYSYEQVLWLHKCFHWLLLYLFARVIGITTRKLQKTTDNVMIFVYMTYIFIAFMVSPFRMSNFRIGSMQAYIDMLLAAYSLISLRLFLTNNRSWLFYIATILLSICGILTHSGYACMYFPIIVMIVVYNVFTQPLNKKNIILNLLIIVLPFLTFVAVTFFSTMNLPIQELQQNMTERTHGELQFPLTAIFFEYYATIADHWHWYAQPLIQYDIMRFIMTMGLMLPLYIILIAPVFMAMLKSNENTKKWMYIFILVTPLLNIPIFIIAEDYGRWFQALTMCLLFMMNIMLAATGEIDYINSVRLLGDWIWKHRAIMLIIVIYLMWLNPNTAATHTIRKVDKICLKYFNLGWHQSPDWSIEMVE